MSQLNRRTYIGVLASRDADSPNVKLIKIFNEYFNDQRKRDEFSSNFHFMITGGTYDRILNGTDNYPGINSSLRDWFIRSSTPLPNTFEGGIIVLSNLICQNMCSIVWTFFEPNTIHWQRQENLALMRLCDQWHIKKFMNAKSVETWLKNETQLDSHRNLQPFPPKLKLRNPGYTIDFISKNDPPQEKTNFKDMTIALIAHNAMKERMIEFAIDHEADLDKFKFILTTRTTGNKVAEVTDLLERKMIKCLTGPKGGDIQIAAEIIYNKCDIVIFFIDPLNPHPHIEDIRVVSEACMINDHAIMITNEAHAREFMTRIVREKDELI